jgi:hypothetical protein
MRKKIFVTSIVLAVSLFVIINPKVYVIRDAADGTLYWDTNEALLFVGTTSSGVRFSYPRYAIEPVLESLGDVRIPDDKRCSQILVIRVTDKEVQRYITGLEQYAEEPYCFTHYVLFNGRIYVGYLAQQKVWRWSSNQFQPATETEFRGFNPLKSAHGSQFDNIEGWSMRENALGRVDSYRITLNGQPLTLVSSGRKWPRGEISLDLIRPGQAPQRIWSNDERPHVVTKTEYQRILVAP